MVAVISGNGLGLGNTSLTQLGQAQGGQASIGQAKVGQYLNLATGNLVLQSMDEGLVFDGLPVNVLRTYNSLGQLTGNQGWLFGFSRNIGGLSGTLNTAGSTVIRAADDGSAVTYAFNASLGLYVSQGQSGSSDNLAWSAATSNWTWTDGASRIQETYNGNGQLQSLRDPTSGAGYSFGYNANGQLGSIAASDGDSLTLGYTGGALSSLTISEIPPGGSVAVVRQQVQYGYDAQGRLQTVTTTLGSDTDTSTASYSTTYTYDGTSDRVASVSQSDGTVVRYTYAQDTAGTYRVSSMTTGTGVDAQSVTLSYNLATDTTTVTDALGRSTNYVYNAAGQLTQVIAPAVNGISPATEYSYDASGNLTQVLDANGRATLYTYDGNGNRLSVEDPTGHTITYTYNADNQLLTQTTYSVPAEGAVGQSGYVAPSGAQTTYYVYDSSDRLNYVIDALGNVTEHDYGSSSGLAVLASTKRYVGVTYSLTGLTPGNPPVAGAVQSWVASSTVQAVLSRVVRTDYSYDIRGQLSQAIQWDALNASGIGSLMSDSGAIVTNYSYDAQGRLLQQSTLRGSNRTTVEVTSYAYDGLGRLISVTDPLNNVTSYAYTDSASQLAITQANGLTITQIRTTAGQLYSSTESAPGAGALITGYVYDAAGQEIVETHGAPVVEYTFYDADGRVAGTVSSTANGLTGTVTAYTYDAAGHVVMTTQYATLVSTSGWLSGQQLTASYPSSLPVPASSASDRTTHTVYDAAGRVVATIDPLGNVATIAYDGNGNAQLKTAYATPLTAVQLSALGSSPAWPALQADITSSPNDRVTRTVYDADNQLVASIDADGYVTTTSYDAAGRVIKVTAYATALTSTQLQALGGTLTPAAVQADLTISANDATTLTYYDDIGRGVAQVDAAGYLTVTTYDETSHTSTATRYATALTTAQVSALTGSETSAALVTLLGSSNSGQVTTRAYDADGRLHQSTAPDGTLTTYGYNTVGQLTNTVVTPGAGQGITRSTSTSYDAYGEVISAKDGNGQATTFTYDQFGRRITATDPLGNTTYTYYDAQGRVIYTVQGQPNGGVANAVGSLVAYSYNAFGQLTSSCRYAGLLTLTTTSTSSGTLLNVGSASDVPPAAAALANAAADTVTTYTYTLDGQVSGTIDGLGYQAAYTYDAFGDLIQQQQQLSAPGSALSAANSTISTYSYDSRGERIGKTDGVGTSVARTASTTYDAFGRVTSKTDAQGGVVTYGYDNLGRQVSTSQTVEGATRATSTTYDAFSRVVTQTDALGNRVTYQYDLANHKTTVTTADNVRVVTVTDAYGDTVTVTDGANNSTTYSYDADGQLLSTTDALGNTASNQYDVDGHLVKVTDATGHVVTYSYDASGRVLSKTVDPSGLNLTTTYTYDGQGHSLSITDPSGSVTRYTYDTGGNLLTQVQDAGSGKLNLTTTYTYDGEGKVLTVTVGAGTSAARTTQYVYDNLERLSQKIVDPSGLGLSTSYAYDGNNNLLSVTDANGHMTRYVYNEANEQAFVIDASGAIVQSIHDKDGRLIGTHRYATLLTPAQSASLGNAPTATQVTTLCGTIYTALDQSDYTVYDAEGRVAYTIDPQGYVTELRYDVAGRLSEKLAYASLPNLTSEGVDIIAMTRGSDIRSNMSLLLSSAGNTDSNAQATLYLYDADGHARFTVSQNNVAGQWVGAVTEKRYDAAGRVVASISYGATLPLSSSQALTAQLTTSSVAQAVANAGNHATYSVYDNAGRLRYTIDPSNHVTETQYDADGRITANITYPNAIALPSTQSIANLASAISVSNSGATGARASYTTYDAAGRVTATADALGTNASYQYDATGLQVGRADRDGHWTYDTYDHAGRKVLEQSPPVTVASYSGNTLQVAANNFLYTSYSYDGVGNVTAISQGYGVSASSITTSTTTAYGYDAVNHQTSTSYPGGVATHVVYNALGQAVVDRDANGTYQYKIYNVDGQVAYSVDGDGYVTGNTYDAYGNVLTATRYATALNTGAIGNWAAGQPLSITQVQQGLVTSASDRTVTTSYNLLNQKVQVTLPTIAYVLTVGPLAGQSDTGTPTTTYTYDAYGNQTSSSTLLQNALTSGSTSTPAIWATTYNYYDALNRVVMSVTPTGLYTNPQGYVTTTSYDAFGDVLAQTQYATAISTSGIGTTNTPGLPPAGTLATGLDRTTTNVYDGIGRKLSQTDTGEYSYVNGNTGFASGSAITSFTYDGEGRVLTSTVNGMVTTTVYDAIGRVVSATSPARPVLVGNWQSLLQQNPSLDLTSASLYTTVSPVVSYAYDALGHVLSATTTAGGQSQQVLSYYDALGRQVQQIDANGVSHYTSYDNNGNVTSQSYALTSNGNSSGNTVTTSFAYDSNNQRTSTSTQTSGRSGYDQYSQVQYNAFGEVVARGDNNGLEAQYAYNNAGQQSAAPDTKTGATHSYGYDLAGHRGVDGVYVTGGSQRALSISTLDLGGQVIAKATPSSSASTGQNSAPLRYTRDRWGNIISSVDEAGNVSQYHYDSQNHVVQVIEANVMVVSATGARTWQAPTMEWYYNVNGQLMAVTDENGNTSWNTYDAAGNVTITQDGVGNRTYHAYDALGRAVAVQTPPANTATGPVARISFTNYDNLNQVTQQGDFLLNGAGTARTQQAQQTYLLNSNGDRIQVTDAMGNTSYYGYDSQHRIIRSQTPIQYANNWAESMSYDANGNKVSDTDANGLTQTWSYDYFGRVRSHVDLSGATTNYSYDASSGLLTSITSNWAPAGQGNPGYIPGSLIGSNSTQNYSYYADGQVSQITQITGSTTTSWDTYQYDANGNQTVDATYTTDGVGSVLHGQTTTRYDSHNRIATVTTSNPDNGVANTRTVYNYDAAGNRRAVFVQSAYGPSSSPISGNGGVPTTSGVGNQVATAGQYFSTNLTGAFTDNIGFGLTFTATGLPAWLNLSSSGVLSGTGSAAGTWPVTVTATDVNGQSVSVNFQVTVPVTAPVFAGGIANQTGSVNSAISFGVPAAADANGASLVYTATCNGGTLPSWLHFDPGALTFTGTPPPGSVGSYTLAVTASASNGGVSSESLVLTVAPTPPVFVGGASNQTTFGGRSFSFGLASTSFSEPDGDSLTFGAGSYTYNNSVESDGALPSWMSFSVSGNTLLFTGTPPTNVVGQTFNIYVVGTNPQGQSAKAYFSVSVNQYVQPSPVYNGGLTNQAGVIGGGSLNVGLPANSFVEPDGGGLTYTGMVLVPAHTLTINKAGEAVDTNVPATWLPISAVGLTVNATTGAITGVPTALSYMIANVSTPMYQYDSAYTLEIIATNGQGGQVGGSFTLTNSYAPPSVQTPIPTQNVTPGTGWSYSVPSNTFQNWYRGNLTYTASNVPSWMSFNAGTFSASSAALEPTGTYYITVTATDALGHSGSTTLTITVPNVKPVFTAPAVNVNAVQGTYFSYQPPAGMDPNGEAVGYDSSMWNGSTFVAIPSWLNFDHSTHTFSGTPPAPGSWNLQMWIGDAAGNLNAEYFTLTVAASNQPPQYIGTLANQDFGYYSGGAVSINASGQFRDPQGQTLTYTSTHPSWLNFNASTLMFTGTTPINKTSGDPTYTVTLTATDTSGLSTTISFIIDNQGSGKNAIAQPVSLMSMSAQTTQATAPNVASYWYTYDADNRVVINNGTLSNGQVVLWPGSYSAPSYANQYDAAGNVVIRLSQSGGGDQFLTAGGVWFSHTAGEQLSQRFVYDARNELVETDYAYDSAREGNRGVQALATYDADGHQLSNNTYYRIGQVWVVTGMPDLGTYYLSLSGWLQTGQVTTYNVDGQVAAQSQFGRWGTDWKSLATMDNNGTLPNESSATPTISSDGALTIGGQTVYTGFDHDDHVTDYTYFQPAAVQGSPTAYGASYHVNYIKKDDYLEQSTTGTPTVSGYVPTTDTSYYDDFGRRIAVGQSSQQPTGTQQSTTRAYAYNATGQILQSRNGTVSGATFTPYGSGSSQHYVYVNGQELGEMDEAGNISMAGNLTGFSSGTGAQAYLVQGGDTLESIAQSVYGNSSLSYIIAAANGFSGNGDLVTGQRITIPLVTTTVNSSSTFKPYNASQIIGSTTPSLAAAPPPPPSASHCSGLAEIVVVAVVVVASIYTAGVAAELLSGGMTALSGATATTIFDAGLSAMTGGLAGVSATVVGGSVAAAIGASATTAAAAFVGGALGSAAGQLTGDAVGISSGFSFGEMLMGGLGAAAGSELGGTLKAGGDLVYADNALTPLGASILGVGRYAANVMASRVSGQATQFSWAQTLGAAVSSGLTTAVGLNGGSLQSVGDSSGNMAKDVAGGLLSGALNRETTMALGDRRVGSWGRIEEDAFGNALGNAAIAGINASNTQRQGQQYDFAELGHGVGDQPTAYQSSDYPTLASGDAYSTYTGAYGLPADNASEGAIEGAPATASNTSQDIDTSDALTPSGPSIQSLYNLGIGGVPVTTPLLAPSVGNDGGWFVTPRGAQPVDAAADAEWNQGIDENIAGSDLQAKADQVMQHRLADAWATQDREARFNTWQKQDAVRFVGIAGAPALLGATAGVGAAFLPAATAYFGSNIVAGGVVWGAVGGVGSTLEQGAEMLAYRATDGMVGQRDFSVGQLGLGIAGGAVLGAAGELVAPYLAKGAQWVMNQVGSLGEGAASASRFTAQQLDLIASEVGGGVPNTTGGAGDTLSAMRRMEFEGADYHGTIDNAVKSRGPVNGQDALDLSVQVKSTSPRRVGIDYETGDFVVFDNTINNVYHGHVRAWTDLRPEMQNALQKAGMVDRRGNILGGQ